MFHRGSQVPPTKPVACLASPSKRPETSAQRRNTRGAFIVDPNHPRSLPTQPPTCILSRNNSGLSTELQDRTTRANLRESPGIAGGLPQRADMIEVPVVQRDPTKRLRTNNTAACPTDGPLSRGLRSHAELRKRRCVEWLGGSLRPRRPRSLLERGTATVSMSFRPVSAPAP